MGGAKRSIECLRIVKIDTVRDLIYVAGAVPGAIGNWVRIRDAQRRPQFPSEPPFPTFVPEEGVEYPAELVYEGGDVDPFAATGLARDSGS